MKTNIKKSQRASVVYNTLPIKVTRAEFNQYIKKYLSKNTRGVKPTTSYFKVFNYILYILHTGIPWYQLPVTEVHWTNIYKHHNRWSKDGTYKKIFEGSLKYLKENNSIHTKAFHGDGSNIVAKKGAKK